MAEPKDEKPKLPLAGLMALLLAAVSSLIIIRAPSRLRDRSTRRRRSLPCCCAIGPIPPLAGSVRGGGDPSTERKTAGRVGQHEHHASPGLVDGAQPPKGSFSFVLLPVFVDGESHASGVESRLRDRYALVSALGRPGICRNRRVHPLLQMELGGECTHDRALRMVSSRAGPPQAGRAGQAGQPAQHILVWLKEQDLSSKAIARTSLVGHLKNAGRLPCLSDTQVPCTSGSLSAMLEELKPTAATPKPVASTLLKGAQFYSSSGAHGCRPDPVWMRATGQPTASRSKIGSPPQA